MKNGFSIMKNWSNRLNRGIRVALELDKIFQRVRLGMMLGFFRALLRTSKRLMGVQTGLIEIKGVMKNINFRVVSHSFAA